MFRPRRVRRGFRLCMHRCMRRAAAAMLRCVRALRETPRFRRLSHIYTCQRTPRTHDSRVTSLTVVEDREHTVHGSKSTHSHTILVHRDAKARQLERTPPSWGRTRARNTLTHTTHHRGRRHPHTTVDETRGMARARRLRTLSLATREKHMQVAGGISPATMQHGRDHGETV